MRSKRVWRYYCDHCKKSGGNKHHLATHEAHCCGNPARVCRMCARAQMVQPSIDTLIAALETGLVLQAPGDNGDAFSADLTALREAAGGCPACMLAAMMQLRKQDTEDLYYFEFDYRAEAQDWLRKTEPKEDYAY